MDKNLLAISNKCNYLFESEDDKHFAENLIQYIVFDSSPKISPALWQDVEIYIRYKKRDVQSFSEERFKNACEASWIYRLKYVTEHLKKSEITKILNDLFRQEQGNHENKTLLELFKEKFHTSIDDLIMVQEKIVITKNELEKFDEIFKYPCWAEFDDEANEIIFEKILRGELSSEQIDYFLGASDHMRNYDKWFKVTKYILSTTKDFHTFWTAGDVLSIIWRAVPEDEKSQKWFRDEIFKIFWPRVENIWPILNQDKIDFDQDEESRILKDSISWLEELDDLKERLPELGDDYEGGWHETPSIEFDKSKELLLTMINCKAPVSELTAQFLDLSEIIHSERDVECLEQIAKNRLLPLIEKSDDNFDPKKTEALIKQSIKYAKKYLVDFKRESKNIAKLVK